MQFIFRQVLAGCIQRDSSVMVCKDKDIFKLSDEICVHNTR